MQSFFIYEVIIPAKTAGKMPSSYVIIFCPDKIINVSWLKNEVKDFFQQHNLPDDIVIIGGEYIHKELVDYFRTSIADTFDNINKVHKPHFEKSINVLCFDENGQIKIIHQREKRPISFYLPLITEGLRKIFIDRGGYIESADGQHYVFPSGKHSPKFLRTGNILLYSPEIYFIAFNILSKYNPAQHEFILCDTSSINSLAFAVADLKCRFKPEYSMPPINSFRSYSIFEEEELVFGGRSLFLVSSSTSGGIIERLKKKMDSIKRENVVLIYFLGEEEKYEQHKDNIICNLNKSQSLCGYGIELFQTYKAQDCVLCQDESIEINVAGDTFLKEQPKVNKVLLKTYHAPASLSKFVNEFKSGKEPEINIIKCNYKENDSPNEQYDIYFDIVPVIDSLLKSEDRFKGFKKDLYKKINLHIPSNTKYIITLPGSEKLAELIKKEFDKTHRDPPVIIPQRQISELLPDDVTGSAVVVSSSMVYGSNLLYLSRTLRDYQNLSIVYFVALIRTSNNENHDFIKKNLGQGMQFGISNNPFIHVLCMYLPDDYLHTPWLNEKIFLGRFIEFLEGSEKYVPILNFFKERLSFFKSVNNANRGLANKLFYPNILDSKMELSLSKNFAFLDFECYGQNSQADIYFIISVILNDLRFRKIKGDTLKQSEYERNVLDPGNFLRFNDGIIQACILRAAKPKELSYDLDENCSSQMKSIIDDMIRHPDRSVSEALFEFVYALVVKKLRLKPDHKRLIYERLRTLKNPYIDALIEFEDEQIKARESKEN